MVEETRKRLVLRGRSWGRKTLWLSTLWVLLIPSADAGAIGALRHPSVEEMVTGGRGILGPWFFSADSAGTQPPPLMVQVSEELLFGIPGLHTSGIRLGGRAAGLFVTAAAAQLSSPIGKETRVEVTPLLSSARWAVSVGFVRETVVLGEMARSGLISLTVRSLARVSGSFRVGGEIDRLRLSGEEFPGTDATIVLTTTPAQGIVLQGTVEVGRTNGIVPGIATTVTRPGPWRFSIGLEGGTDVLKGAIGVRWGAIDLAAGIFYHPVLGEKRGVTVTWFG